MAAAIGADVEQLRALAKQFTASAEKLQRSSSGLTNFVGNATYWRGIDADRFRTQWRSQSVPSISAVVTSLRTAAEALASNANEQDQASAAGGGGNISTGVGAGGAAPKKQSPADETSSLWETVHETPGYRVQKIEGLDGKTRYIVYVGGTGATNLIGKGQSWASNVAAMADETDWDEVNKVVNLINKNDKGSEVMLVGWSQGGIDAQNIAARGLLNVTQVVTFGAPVRGDVNVSSVNFNSALDPVTYTPYVGGIGPYGIGNPHNWIHNPNHEIVTGSNSHTGYGGLADSYDANVKQEGPSSQGAHIQFFKGKVLEDVQF